MTDIKIQELADKFTNDTMTAMFGVRFIYADDVTLDEEMNRKWEYLNEKFYETINASINI